MILKTAAPCFQPFLLSMRMRMDALDLLLTNVTSVKLLSYVAEVNALAVFTMLDLLAPPVLGMSAIVLL